ncbi:hypothetical protein ABK040_016605 [Willaertia magna]
MQDATTIPNNTNNNANMTDSVDNIALKKKKLLHPSIKKRGIVFGYVMFLIACLLSSLVFTIFWTLNTHNSPLFPSLSSVLAAIWIICFLLIAIVTVCVIAFLMSMSKALYEKERLIMELLYGTKLGNMVTNLISSRKDIQVTDSAVLRSTLKFDFVMVPSTY